MSTISSSSRITIGSAGLKGVLAGGEGDDVLLGGPGIDVIDGQVGDDIEIQLVAVDSGLLA